MILPTKCVTFSSSSCLWNNTSWVGLIFVHILCYLMVSKYAIYAQLKKRKINKFNIELKNNWKKLRNDLSDKL